MANKDEQTIEEEESPDVRDPVPDEGDGTFTSTQEEVHKEWQSGYSACGERTRDTSAPHLPGLHVNAPPAGQTDAREQSAKPTSPTQFSYLMPTDLQGLFEKHFARLDADDNGYVSKDEVDKAFQDTSLKGKDAQMIFALKRYHAELQTQSHDELGYDNDGITRADMAAFDQNTRAARAESALTSDVSAAGLHYFKQLDSDKDGYLTRDEIQKGLAEGKVDKKTRDAVESMLDRFDVISQRNDDDYLPDSSITAKDLSSYAHAGRESKEWKLQDDILYAFGAVSTTMQGASEELFANTDAPLKSITPDAIKQGGIGNCSFLAALTSLAATNPQAIKDMIKDNGDRTFSVTFPGLPGQTFTVKAPSEAERTANVRASKHGIWPQIMEKAYGEYQNTWSWSTSTVAAEAGDGYPLVSMNGVQLLGTGKYKQVFVGLTSYDTQHDTLKAAMEQKIPVMAHIALEGNLAAPLFDGYLANGLVSAHAYAVIGYDPETQSITIRNPHGRGEPRAGYPGHDGVNDGTFQMSLQEFNKWFSTLNYPTK